MREANVAQTGVVYMHELHFPVHVEGWRITVSILAVILPYSVVAVTLVVA
jgi:hypothetical protein